MTMEKGQNKNHPKKGSTIKVEPIKRKQDIKNIKKLLKDNPRDHALFVLGINTNMRAGDMLKLKVGQVRGKEPGDILEIKEQKTNKSRSITLNKAVVDALDTLLTSPGSGGDYQNDEDPLFMGQRGPLTVPTLSRMVKQWCKHFRLEGNYAAHTLRKTWGYHQRVTFGTDIPTLMTCFNHSSQKQTLDYLCVQPDEIKSVYENEL